MTKQQELLIIIVPCYNEEHNVSTVIDNIQSIIPRIKDIQVRVRCVDDGSTDNTLRVLKRLAEVHSNIDCVANQRNKGLGRLVLDTIQEIPPKSWFTVIPGDNQLSVESLVYFVEHRHDYDLILGYLQNPVVRPLKRRVASLAFGTIVNFVFGFNYRYINGLILGRSGTFQKLEVIASGHAYGPELIAKALLRSPHLQVGELPYVQLGRATGVSKAIQPRSIVRAVIEVYKSYHSVAEYREHIAAGQR